MIIPYVKDSVDRVRSVAIDFLLDLDVHEAAPVFIEQLSKEDDEEHVYEVNLEIQRTLGMIEPLGTHSPTVSQELG